MDQQKNADRLLALFERQNEDGNYYYADEDVRHLLPLLVLSVAVEDGRTEWPPSTQRMMNEFVQRIGLLETATPDDLASAIDAYYQANPVNEELRKNFQVLMRELIAEGSTASLSQAASKLLGIQPQTLKPKNKAASGVSLTNLMIRQVNPPPKGENDGT